MKHITIYWLLAFLLAGNMVVFPQNNGKENSNEDKGLNADSYAAMCMEKLQQDIQLTESQKPALEKEFKLLYDNRQNSAKKSDRKEEINSKKEAYEIFIVARDNILTEEQRNILFAKIEERKANAQSRNKLTK